MVLCLTRITGWGVLFYAFPVLVPAIGADAGGSGTAVIGAFSVAQLVGAVVAAVFSLGSVPAKSEN